MIWGVKKMPKYVAVAQHFEAYSSSPADRAGRPEGPQGD
jgi:hypothetical protein